MRVLVLTAFALSACGSSGPLDCSELDPRPDLACDYGDENGMCVEYNYGDEVVDETPEETCLDAAIVDACPRGPITGDYGDGKNGGCAQRLGTTGCFVTWADAWGPEPVDTRNPQALTECAQRDGFYFGVGTDRATSRRHSGLQCRPREDGCSRRQARFAPTTPSRTAATGSSASWAAAAWPSSGAPATASSTAIGRSRS